MLFAKNISNLKWENTNYHSWFSSWLGTFFILLYELIEYKMICITYTVIHVVGVILTACLFIACNDTQLATAMRWLIYHYDLLYRNNVARVVVSKTMLCFLCYSTAELRINKSIKWEVDMIRNLLTVAATLIKK